MSRSKKRRRKDKPRKVTRKNIIIDQTKNVPNQNKVLNQFICAECYHVALVTEDAQKETPKYQEKMMSCSCCLKDTTHICVKDRAFTQSMLEMTKERTKKEERAFQIIKCSRRTNSK